MDKPPQLRIAFLGNSITYYNDLVHLVQLSLETEREVVVGACLRGGQSLASLMEKGGELTKTQDWIGGRDMHASVEELLRHPQGWDFIVFQDHTQGPAREDDLPAIVEACTPKEVSRGRGLASLREQYAPLFRAVEETSGRRPTLVVYETWGYRADAKGSEEIGDFPTFTAKLL